MDMPVIEFLCPNGHKIRCKDDQSGRAAKCPRCGVKFCVPDSMASGPPEVAEFDSSSSLFDWANLGMVEPELPAAESAAPKEPQFEFLCPNGHRLHGPLSLQGRPGACPECNSRFRIPSYDDISAEEQPEGEISLGRVDGSEGSDARKRTATSPSQPPELPAQPRSAETGLSPLPQEAKLVEEVLKAVSPIAIDADSAGQTMAALFLRLWRLRNGAATVELLLHDGQMIVPDQFLEKLSQPGHGVFAVKEQDGTMSLVALAWESITRATLRGLSEVPKELADY
jgi:hypothetical protein